MKELINQLENHDFMRQMLRDDQIRWNASQVEQTARRLRAPQSVFTALESERVVGDHWGPLLCAALAELKAIQDEQPADDDDVDDARTLLLLEACDRWNAKENWTDIGIALDPESVPANFRKVATRFAKKHRIKSSNGSSGDWRIADSMLPGHFAGKPAYSSG